jgi:CRP-like cAMP-binding protein
MTFLELFRNWDDVEEHEAGTVIFAERDPSDVLYVILSGEVELTLQGNSLGAEGEGGIIGEMALIESAPRTATVTVLSKVKLARLDRNRFQELVGKNPEFSLHAMAILAKRLRAVDNFIITHLDK